MRRLVSRVLIFSAAAFVAAGCATYAQELDRARRHYESNQYEQALALFRVLEHDMDSYSPAEQAQYAYLRGMTDYRLAGLAPQGSGVADPRKGYRDNSRHWLALAAAIEKETPGGITADEKQRLNETLTDLNRDVYGGAETLPEGGAAPPAGAQPAAAPAQPAAAPAQPPAAPPR
jgi:hypothetical protein